MHITPDKNHIPLEYGGRATYMKTNPYSHKNLASKCGLHGNSPLLDGSRKLVQSLLISQTDGTHEKEKKLDKKQNPQVYCT